MQTIPCSRIELLRECAPEVLRLIQSGWIKKQYARTAPNEPTCSTTDPKAACFCIEGAIHRAVHVFFKKRDPAWDWHGQMPGSYVDGLEIEGARPDLRRQPFAVVEAELLRLLRDRDGAGAAPGGLIDWNDRDERTHDEVLALLREFVEHVQRLEV